MRLDRGMSGSNWLRATLPEDFYPGDLFLRRGAFNWTRELDNISAHVCGTFDPAGSIRLSEVAVYALIDLLRPAFLAA